MTSNLTDLDTKEMDAGALKTFVKNVLELPEYFGLLLRQKLKKLTRPRVKAYFKQKLSLKTRNERAFELLFNNYNLSHEVDNDSKTPNEKGIFGKKLFNYRFKKHKNSSFKDIANAKISRTRQLQVVRA